jgi:DNA-binding IclR family transcriptional regulator
VLALVAAWHDRGRASVSTAEIAGRLALKRSRAIGLLNRLEADGYVVRTASGRWRVADGGLEGER